MGRFKFIEGLANDLAWSTAHGECECPDSFFQIRFDVNFVVARHKVYFQVLPTWIIILLFRATGQRNYGQLRRWFGVHIR